MRHTPSRALLAALVGSALVALAAPAPSSGASTLTTLVSAPILQPSLTAHLASISSTAPTRVLVQAGGNLAAAKDAVRSAGLRLESSLDRIGIAVGVGTSLTITRLATTAGVTRVDWADEKLSYYADTVNRTTRAEPVHDAAYDVTGDEQGDAFDGAGFSVAVIDGGVDGTHPMFQGPDGSKVRKNVKIVCSDDAPNLVGTYVSIDGCAVDQTVINDTDSASVGGHGTHVSGTVAGYRVTDAADRHLRGAAPGADLVGIGTGAFITVYGGAAGMEWLLEHHADPCGDGSCPPVIAVNNSWGPAGGGNFDETAPGVLAQRALVAEGVTVVWAAANSGGDGTVNMVNPASQDPTPGVLSIANYDDASTGNRDYLINGSSSRGLAGSPGTYPDLAAPGTNITSACRKWLVVCGLGGDEADPDYNTISGTSMAAPSIAGYVAVLQQAALATTGAVLTPGAIEDLMVDSAHQFGTRTWDADTRNADSTTPTSFDAGHGLVDVTAALARLTGQNLALASRNGCPVDARFTDAAGDATGDANGTLDPTAAVTSVAALDVLEGWLDSDVVTNDVTFHWKVADVPALPAGTQGEGEHFDFAFNLGGRGYHLAATRTATDGESFVLSHAQTVLATGLAGSFDVETDEIQVAVPADLIAASDTGAPLLARGIQLDGFRIVARRFVPEDVYLGMEGWVPADTINDVALAGCGYTVGAEHVLSVNATPEILAASVTGQNKVLRAGKPLTFLASATDADGDFLTYSWSFGDGTTDAGALVEHVISASGTYTATVTVSDGTESVSRTVTYTVKGK